MKPILEVQHLAKKFKIHHLGGYLSLRERLLNFSRSAQTAEEFWALNDVSFSVNPGESIGIIGKNGAGKSTLLKILSKITPPTKGRFVVRGRIASLLEVGTGFHPELTGRENIFFNGSLLGMKSKEIQNKFDEIVDFSGTEKFLDTPLKHYSSGMQLRLAFSVSAFLEPEILIIDEVLAVGDAEFQKKCLGKMDDVSKSGRTILFVSHNLTAVSSLCQKAIWIEKGKVVNQGTATEIIEKYAQKSQVKSERRVALSEYPRERYKGAIQFKSLQFENNLVRFGEKIKIKLDVQALHEGLSFRDVNIALNINNTMGNCLIHCSNEFIGKSIAFDGRDTSFEFSIDNTLRPGLYSVTLFMRTKEVIQDWLVDVASFNVEEENPYGYTDTGSIQGLVFPGFSIVQHKGDEVKN